MTYFREAIYALTYLPRFPELINARYSDVPLESSRIINVHLNRRSRCAKDSKGPFAIVKGGEMGSVISTSHLRSVFRELRRIKNHDRNFSRASLPKEINAPSRCISVYRKSSFLCGAIRTLGYGKAIAKCNALCMKARYEPHCFRKYKSGC